MSCGDGRLRPSREGEAKRSPSEVTLNESSVILCALCAEAFRPSL